MNYTNIIWAVIWFAALGGALGLVLAFAAKVFAVKVDERVEKTTSLLPGANCGGCGYTGCAALAQAIVDGKAKPSDCSVAGEETAKEIAEFLGIEAGNIVRMRAQVMCSGTNEFARKKYEYKGVPDCIAAAKLGGGDKLCPNGCIGLGTCAARCKFNAIRIDKGIAAVDYRKCTGCGVCVTSCPKNIIRLIPFNSKHWVGCLSVDKGAVTRKYCDVGCISCKMCEKVCESDAIKVNNFVASIDYDKCTGCDKCVEVCPRKVIWSSKTQGDSLFITREKLEDNRNEVTK